MLAYLLVRIALRYRWQAVSTMLCAGALAAALVALLLDVAAVDPGELVVPDLDLGPISAGWFPSAAGIAVLAALLTATAPWSSRTWRRLGWVAVLGLTLTRFLVTAVSFDSLRAVLIGWFAGGATLVALGAPLRRPTAGAIAAGLGAVGLPLESIEPASVDARGSTPYFAVGSDGGKLFVKALGRDERSADLLFRVYRWVQRHDLGDERPFSSLRRAVEHEAFVALAARDLGIRTPRSASASPRPSRARSSSPTTGSMVGPSTACRRTRSPTTCWPRSGSNSERFERTASPTATSVLPTSSSSPTARC